jgi:hypothetical protein
MGDRHVQHLLLDVLVSERRRRSRLEKRALHIADGAVGSEPSLELAGQEVTGTATKTPTTAVTQPGPRPLSTVMTTQASKTATRSNTRTPLAPAPADVSAESPLGQPRPPHHEPAQTNAPDGNTFAIDERRRYAQPQAATMPRPGCYPRRL